MFVWSNKIIPEIPALLDEKFQYKNTQIIMSDILIKKLQKNSRFSEASVSSRPLSLLQNKVSPEVCEKNVTKLGLS